jgi:hypothetical protein
LSQEFSVIFAAVSLCMPERRVRMLADGDLLQAYLAHVQLALRNQDVACAQALLTHAQEFLPPSRLPLSSCAAMQMSVGVGLDTGIRRQGKPNEDFVFAHSGTNTQTQATYGLFIVADGMGGHADGQMGEPPGNADHRRCVVPYPASRSCATI